MNRKPMRNPDGSTRIKPDGTPDRRLKAVGRKKGSINILGRDAKAALETAFENLGGIDAMVKWAQRSDANMTAFYQVWSRLIPRQINLPTAQSGGGTVTLAAILMAAQNINQLPASAPLIDAKPTRERQP